MNMKYYLTIVIHFSSISIWAQLPKTDVYMASLNKHNGKVSIDNIQYLTDFNQNGYNNQAYFFSEDLIFITSDYKSEGQTDILALNPKEKTYFKVTETYGISEFSPIPAVNKTDFYTVRIEKNGKDQSLWKYPLSRSNYGERLFSAIQNIGYYCWLNATQVALFLVDEPHRLVIGNTLSGRISTIVDNPGRCLKTNGKGILYFVHKVSPDLWILKYYDINEDKILSIGKMLNGTEDFEILPDGTFFAASKGRLFTFDPNNSIQWTEIADLSALGISNIQRPVFKNNKLLFINAK